ncbi:helix-turn-helix domain-containing protein [Clostridium sp. DSM 100503]|uniref:helix-turn-helix domain-containing protein n=1 Tax=Clostridium sp. DSM 100503 TaxID=2963282 RepID=UPI00214A5B93|nr:helix-turn-helix domain-containing protein [Clostridium sp. DSM 100503]MCR1952858.1 helix-turn-helix domain-containing protein [Clostridium sp. DSM 100503]
MGEISELQSRIIEMILEGKEKTKIAKELNIARSWLYKLMDKPEFKAELETRRNHLRKSAKDKITGQVNTLTDEMLKLARESTDQRVKYNAIKYLLDRSLGVPTTAKEEDNSDDKEKNKDVNDLKAEMEEIKKLTVIK